MAQPHTDHEANGAIKLIAGPFVDEVSAIWSEGRITEYLAANDCRRHVWHACLSSEHACFGASASFVALSYSRLTFGKSKDLILQAYGCRPRGLIGVLGRLGPQARSPEVYQMLVEVLEHGGPPAKVMMHACEPTDELIETMAMLPDDMNWRTVSGLIGSSRFEVPETLAMFVWTAARLQHLDQDQDSEMLMKADRPVASLLDRLIRRPFPAPPWRGDNTLRPLTTGHDVLELGKHFGNCLGEDKRGETEILGVLNGFNYFYEWKGREMAVIKLVRLADIGWYASEARGIKNADISRTTRREIAQAFLAASNICTTRLTIRSNIYPCSQFWGEIVRRGQM